MSSREKDKSDFDLERFVDLFDAAISSDNPAVQRALKNLLLIASLVDSEIKPEERVRGPLRRLVDDLHNLNKRIGQLEQTNSQTYKYPSTTHQQLYKGAPNTVTSTSFTGPHQTYTTTTLNSIISLGDPFSPETILGNLRDSTDQAKLNTSQGASSTAYDDQFTKKAWSVDNIEYDN